jgi:hypothetical protein
VRTRRIGPQRLPPEQDGAITARLKPCRPVIASTLRLNRLPQNAKRVSSGAKAHRKQSLYVGAKDPIPLKDRLFRLAVKPCLPVVASKVRRKRLREDAEIGWFAGADAGRGKPSPYRTVPYRRVEVAPRLRRCPIAGSAFRLRECPGARS